MSLRPLHVRFFAILREQAGCAAVEASSTAANPTQLYTELQQRFPGLVFPVTLLRVSVNERYVAMDVALNAGDRIVFIPPIAGG
jgi:molybdopterin converting factor small subunit